MIPILEIPSTIQEFLKTYRSAFVREAGFEHVSRYITGLLTSPNKTLQAIHQLQRWPEGQPRTRRAMHEAIFEGAWKPETLSQLHWDNIDTQTRSRGKRVLWLDWTFLHHPKGPKIWGNDKKYDYVERRYTRYQTLVTFGLCTPNRVDGLSVELQAPRLQEEEEYLRQTSKSSFESMEKARERLLDMLAHWEHRKQYVKRTDIAAELIRQLESEGGFEEADYAFDNGLLCKQVAEAIEEAGKEWVSQLEGTRLVLWNDQWTPIREVASHLKENHPNSFREYSYQKRNGESEKVWAFTKVLRLKKYGRKRIVIMHRTADLSDEVTYFITSGISWKPPRILTTWSFRWGAELFHEFAKQSVGLEDSQCRNEESVKRHAVLCCLAQSILQSVPGSGATLERFAWADGNISLGQRSYTLARQLWEGILEWARNLWTTGSTNEQLLEFLLPS